MKSLVVIAMLLYSGAGFAPARHQNAGTRKPTQVVNQKALWQPGMGIMGTIREACGSAGDFGQCFVAQMQKSGASPQAIAFTKLTGNTGFMRDFREAGRVDVAYVNYPFRANENQGCLLVNGEPQAIDVDDISLLPQDEMRKSAAYVSLAAKYPNATIFPGDRNGIAYPKIERLPDGGQRFVVSYRLVDGCHACARIGDVSFAFDFDRAGKLTGRKFLAATRAGQ